MREKIQQCLIHINHIETLTDIPFDKDDLDVEDRYTTHLKPAAVLLPVVEREAGLHLILTQRTEHLHNHAGQICFPGGRRDDSDKTPIETALRETEEEIGLQRQNIDIAGCLNNYKTGTGFLITSVVGFVNTEFTLRLDSFEVAEAFEVPLAFLLDKKNHQRESMVYQGKERFYHVIYYQNRRIWGATAGILVNFSHRFHALV